MKVTPAFSFHPAEPGMDAEYVLNANPNITIQDASQYGGGLVVNEWIESIQGSKPHKSFLSVQDAKAFALALNAPSAQDVLIKPNQ